MEIHEPNESIELLYTNDCKAWPMVLVNLKKALKQLGIKEKPRLIAIDTIEQAELYNFFSSPTIHIEGVDIDPHSRHINKRGLGCDRPYFYAGKAWKVPPVEFIMTNLHELYQKT
jgi:hypothetical protein